MDRNIGNFVNGKKKGKFEVYSDMGDDQGNWSTENFKWILKNLKLKPWREI